MSNDIEIFRTGRFQSIDGRTLSFSDRDLAATAGAYDPKLSQAPIVIGHPKLDAPAYGWVTDVRQQGDRLVANIDQLDTAFADQLKAGRYRKVSAAFYDPDEPNNPVPGTYYLRHVGFLGATPPAIKGLKQAQFADGDSFIAFGEDAPAPERSALAWLSRVIRSQVRAETARATAGDPEFFNGAQEDLVSQTAFADREAAIVARETALNTRAATLDQREQGVKTKETAFSEQERSRLVAADTAVLEALEKSGQSLPVWRKPLLAMMERLHGAPVIAFGEGDAKVEAPMIEAFHEMLQRLPKVVEFGEIARTPIVEAGASLGTSFIAPRGDQVDPDRLELRDRALAYAEKNKVPFIEAVRRLEREAV